MMILNIYFLFINLTLPKNVRNIDIIQVYHSSRARNPRECSVVKV